jgi:hypothetical protein
MHGDIEHYAMHKLQRGNRTDLDGVSRANRKRRRKKSLDRLDSKKPRYRNGVEVSNKYACL